MLDHFRELVGSEDDEMDERLQETNGEDFIELCRELIESSDELIGSLSSCIRSWLSRRSDALRKGAYEPSNELALRARLHRGVFQDICIAVARAESLELAQSVAVQVAQDNEENWTSFDRRTLRDLVCRIRGSREDNRRETFGVKFPILVVGSNNRDGRRLTVAIQVEPRADLVSIQTGSEHQGRLFVDGSTADIFQTAEFQKALEAAWEYVLSKYSAAIYYDYCWRLEATSDRFLDGPSGGAAFALGLRRLLIDVQASQSQSHADPLRNISLDAMRSIAISAAIQSNGQLQPVGEITAKVLAAIRDPIGNAPRIRHFLVAKDQQAAFASRGIFGFDQDFLDAEGVRIHFCDSVDSIVESLNVAESVFSEIIDCSDAVVRRPAQHAKREWLYDCVKEGITSLSQTIGGGYLILKGDTLFGKTALVAGMVRRAERPIYHFIDRENPGADNPELIMRSLSAQLQRKHRVPASIRTDYGSGKSHGGLDAAILLFDKVIKWVSDNRLDSDNHETIFVDAMDEAFAPWSKYRNSSALPGIFRASLPCHVFFVMTTRKTGGNRTDVSWLGDCAGVEILDLDQLSIPHSKADAEDFIAAVANDNGIELTPDVRERLLLLGRSEVDSQRVTIGYIAHVLSFSGRLRDDLLEWNRNPRAIPTHGGLVDRQWERALDGLRSYLSSQDPVDVEVAFRSAMAAIAIAGESLTTSDWKTLFLWAGKNQRDGQDRRIINFEFLLKYFESICASAGFLVDSAASGVRFRHSFIRDYIERKLQDADETGAIDQLELEEMRLVLSRICDSWRSLDSIGRELRIRRYAIRQRLRRKLDTSDEDGFVAVLRDTEYIKTRVELSRVFEVASDVGAGVLLWPKNQMLSQLGARSLQSMDELEFTAVIAQTMKPLGVLRKAVVAIAVMVVSGIVAYSGYRYGIPEKPAPSLQHGVWKADGTSEPVIDPIRVSSSGMTVLKPVLFPSVRHGESIHVNEAFIRSDRPISLDTGDSVTIGESSLAVIAWDSTTSSELASWTRVTVGGSRADLALIRLMQSNGTARYRSRASNQFEVDVEMKSSIHVRSDHRAEGADFTVSYSQQPSDTVMVGVVSGSVTASSGEGGWESHLLSGDVMLISNDENVPDLFRTSSESIATCFHAVQALIIPNLAAPGMVCCEVVSNGVVPYLFPYPNGRVFDSRAIHDVAWGMLRSPDGSLTKLRSHDVPGMEWWTKTEDTACLRQLPVEHVGWLTSLTATIPRPHETEASATVRPSVEDMVATPPPAYEPTKRPDTPGPREVVDPKPTADPPDPDPLVLVTQMP